MDNSDKQFFLGALIGAILFGTLSFLITRESIPRVDLPEEYKSITTNYKQPDTLMAHMNGETLIIEFLPKYRH